MTDEIKYDILNLVNSQRHVLGVSHSAILEHLLEQQMDIKVANTYINSLVDEGWLIKNIHSLAAYNLSDKAIMWLHEYTPKEIPRKSFNWDKGNFINGIIALLLAVATLMLAIKCPVNNRQHDKDTGKQHNNTGKQTPDTSHKPPKIVK